MKKQLTLAVLSMALGAFGSTFASATATMHKPQADLWYNNNFGASAKEVFPVLQPEQIDENAYHVGLGYEDVDLMLAGRVRQEGFIFNRATTLRSDYNDLYGFTRSKLNIDMRTQYGRRRYGKPAAQMHARLTSFSVWDAANEYTPVLDQEVYFDAGNFIKRAEIGKHKHRGAVPLMFLDQGWVRVNFDAFMSAINNEVALQVGHFPFIVGRGISLGDYPFTGVEFMGWEREADIGNGTQAPVGVLMHFGLGKNNEGALEFYYSQSRKRSHAPDWTREEIRAKRIDLPQTDDPADIQRGTANDQNIYALRGAWNMNLGKGKMYVEPYAVYVKAPELKVERDGDAQARLFTFGGMAEYSHGNWAVNAEIAGQVGTHEMFAIDRNHLVVDDAYYLEQSTAYIDGLPDGALIAGRVDEKMGQPVKYHSHILLGTQKLASALGVGEDPVSEYLPYRAYYVSDETQHVNADVNRGIHAQGARVVVGDNIDNENKPDTDPVRKWVAGEDYRSAKFSTADYGVENGGLYGAYAFKTGIDYYDKKFIFGTRPDGSLFNANIPFGGMQRFRPGYKLSCQSVMAMLDVAYTTPDKRAKFAAAAGYVGGDKYPFNEEVDKDYNGFIPMRDGNYVGRWVTSFVMLYPRKLPRPTDMADKDFYGHKNYQTMQNLQYLGLSAKWLPFKSKDTLSCEVNGLYFWQVEAPAKWDVYAKRKFVNSWVQDGVGKEDTQYEYIQEKELNFKGAATTERASKNLGAELNFVIKWQPFSNCELVCRGGAFFPGALYDDIQGCPSINTRRVDKDGRPRYDSLGTKMVTGGMLRATYKF